MPPWAERIFAKLRLSPWTLLSSALIVFAFAPWDLYPLIWIAMVPWIWGLRKIDSFRMTFYQGIWLSFFMTLGGYYWIAYAVHRFGKLPYALSIPLLLLFGLFNQFQFPIYAVLRRWVRERVFQKTLPFWGLLLLVICYTGIDWFVPKLWRDTLGHSLYVASWIRQCAELGGASLLTFFIMLHSESLVDMIAKRKVQLHYIGVVLLLLGAGLWGMFRADTIQKLVDQPEKTVQMGVIQANIGDFEKVAAYAGLGNAANQIVGTYLQLSQSALQRTPRPEVLVWPETSYPSTFRTPNSNADFMRQRRIENFVRTNNVPLLFGGYDRNRKIRKDYNSFFFLTPKPVEGLPGEGDMQIYHKSIILPFAEYIPGQDTFDFIDKAFPQVGNFGIGPGPSVYTVPIRNDLELKFNPIICYEILFPEFVIEAARKGSQFILNITNDSWFGKYAEPHLHQALSTFRSIETRQPQVRSTNTGFTSLILPTGEITQQTDLWVPTVVNMTVPLNTPPETLLVRFGDWFGWLCTLSFFFLMIFFEVYRRRIKI